MFFQNLALLFIMSLAAPWLASLLPREYWLPLVGVTALSLTGQYLMSWSYARAEAQYLINTEYTAFIWAIALGWFFFGEAVSWETLAGAGLIIVSCWIAARASMIFSTTSLAGMPWLAAWSAIWLSTSGVRTYAGLTQLDVTPCGPPSSARRRTTWLPIPAPAPPVTSATFPSKSFDISCSFAVRPEGRRGGAGCRA